MYNTVIARVCMCLCVISPFYFHVLGNENHAKNIYNYSSRKLNIQCILYDITFHTDNVCISAITLSIVFIIVY